MDARVATKLIKPKTKRGQRELHKREAKLVEDAKRALLLYGNKTSQLVKDVLADLHKLKAGESVKFTRKNDAVRPFEPGGEAQLEHWARTQDCALFALGSHLKKRPHNLVLGRFFDHRVYDLLELGVERFQPIKQFAAAAKEVQAGNKPCFVFIGEQFDSVPEFKQAKSLLLDFFRGQQVDAINLAGIQHVMFVTALDRKLLLRQYRIRLKKSGTRVPRVELAEMGPSLDLSIRRHRGPPDAVEREAHRQPKPLKKKVKNMGKDLLDGKVGRIYMPKQDVDSMALHKMKGTKRARQEKAAAGGTGAAAAQGGAADPALSKRSKAAAFEMG